MADRGIRIDDSKVGDVAGRDIDKSNKYVFSGTTGTYMKSLLDKYQKELETNAQMQEFIDDLDYYNNKKPDDVIGLDEKLIAGDRKNLILFATDYKDRFHRLLYKFQFSEAAQKILAHLLAEVQSRFINEIYPMICKDVEEEKINLMITERLINPVKEELGENCLGITVQHINGMMYFLTGNCHIKWNK